jgi:hypothetical protein
MSSADPDLGNSWAEACVATRASKLLKDLDVIFELDTRGTWKLSAAETPSLRPQRLASSGQSAVAMGILNRSPAYTRVVSRSNAGNADRAASGLSASTQMNQPWSPLGQ